MLSMFLPISDASLGMILVVAAGLLNSIYGIPMKKTEKWAFENVWLVYSVVAMGVMSWGTAALTIPNLFQVYRTAGMGAVGLVFCFGLLWGIANLLFGMGMRLIGIGLTFPIAIGLSLAIGTMTPLIAKHDLLLTPGGILVVASIVLVMIGVACCGFAGILRERMEKQNRTTDEQNSHVQSRTIFLIGLFVVIISGLTDPCLNFAFSFGDAIKKASIDRGQVVPGAESDAIWAIALSGALIVNTFYCLILLVRNGSWKLYLSQGTSHYWILAAIMGIVWTLSITLYGRGATKMGPLGDSAGWAVFYCCIILFSAIWAFLTGEWKQATRHVLRPQLIGLALITAAILLLGYGNTLP